MLILRGEKALAALVMVLCAVQECCVWGTRIPKDFSINPSRSLKAFELVGLYNGCPQGKQGINTEETNSNPPDWWENNWGRTGDQFPRRGTQECWDNRGSVCPLPDQDHVVCLPGSVRGSTANKGWALDPKAQSCQPGVHCPYACEPGYYWTMFNQSETSNFDSVNGPKVGHCDGTWDYGTSTHGIYCNEQGNLELPSDKPLCQLGETYVYAENHLDTHVFLCQTVFPGHEIFLIPTLVRPGESVMITTQPLDYWHGPTYEKPTHGDFYVSFAGADIMEACTWDGVSPSGASRLPYEIGSGVEDNGFVYSTHYFYQQPNSEVPTDKIGYQLDLECESSEPGVCAPVFRNLDVVKADVLRKPSPGTTKVKFIFTPDGSHTKFPDTYQEPNHVYLDTSKIPQPSGRGQAGVIRDPVPQYSTGNDGKEEFPHSQGTEQFPGSIPAAFQQVVPAEQVQLPPPAVPVSPPLVQPSGPVLTPQVVQPEVPLPVPLPQPQGGRAVCVDGACYTSMPEHMKNQQPPRVLDDGPVSNGVPDDRRQNNQPVSGEDIRYVADHLHSFDAMYFGR